MLTELTIPGSLIGNKKKSIRLEGIRPRESREEFPEGLFKYPEIDGWEAEGTHIEIDVEEIRHYSGKRCAEFFATASEPGTYKLKCRLMCAEYADPDYQELTVEVLKAGQV